MDRSSIVDSFRMDDVTVGTPLYFEIERTPYPIDANYVFTFEYALQNGYFDLAVLLWEKANGGFTFDANRVLIQCAYGGHIECVQFGLEISGYKFTDTQLVKIKQNLTGKDNHSGYNPSEKKRFREMLDWLNRTDTKNNPRLEMIAI